MRGRREREREGGWEPCDADGGKSGWSVVTKGQHMARYKSLLLQASQSTAFQLSVQHRGTWADLSLPTQGLRALCSVLRGKSLGQLQGTGRAGTLGVPSL